MICCCYYKSRFKTSSINISERSFNFNSVRRRDNILVLKRITICK